MIKNIWRKTGGRSTARLQSSFMIPGSELADLSEHHFAIYKLKMGELSSRHNLPRAIRQCPLKAKCFADRCRHPEVDFLAGLEDDGHGFWIDQPNFQIWLDRQKAKEVTRCLTLLDFADRLPACPDAGEACERPIEFLQQRVPERLVAA